MIKETLVKGMKVTVPLLFTFIVVVWAAQTIEAIFSTVLKPILPFYFPGLGALIGIASIFMVGLLINAWIVQAFWSWVERGIDKIPFIKTIYSYFSEAIALVDSSKSSLGTPVVVEVAGMKLLGFITSENLKLLSMGEDEIAIYLPMSYQVGGYTVIVPRSRVELISLSTHETMKFVLTAGVTTHSSSHL